MTILTILVTIRNTQSKTYHKIWPNEQVAKEPYFKVYAFMTDSNENKLLCYESHLHKMGFDTINY